MFIYRNFTKIIILLLLVIAPIMAGCNGMKPKPAPVCTPALACVSVIPVTSDCPKLAWVDGSQAVLWRTRNLHPDRTIFVIYKRVIRHLNQPPKDEETDEIYREIPPSPSGTTPDLGCKYQIADEIRQKHDEYYFEPIKACFKDDGTCALIRPVEARPPGVDCSKSCDPSFCLTYDMSSTAANPDEIKARKRIIDFASHALHDNPLKQLDISGLLNISGVNACTNRAPGTVNNGRFFSDGETCKIVALFPLQPASQVEITVPSFLRGKISQRLNSSTTIEFDNPDEAIRMEYFDSNNASLGSEVISRIFIFNDSIRLIGSRRNCIWLLHMG